MPVSKFDLPSLGDTYIDYPGEEMMFRYDAVSRRFYRKHYGDNGEREVPFYDEMMNEALSVGVVVDRAAYDTAQYRVPGRNGLPRSA